jgi:hypothetical protein
MPDEQEFSPEEAVVYLRDIHGKPHSVGALGQLRSRGRGPAFYRRNNRIIYKRLDLDRYAEAQPAFEGPFHKTSDARRNPTPKEARQPEHAA